MVNQELGGNIVLSNFDLDEQEIIIAKKLIGNYAEKIRNFGDYEELKIEMKTHLKGKNKHFEIKALLLYNGNRASAEANNTNPFVAISEILEKILKEIEHKIKK